MPSLVYNKIAIRLLTNIPGKKEIVFSRRLFYNPDFKEEDGQLSEYPILVINRKYKVDTIRKMTLFDKISFFFNENVLLSRKDAYDGEILGANNDANKDDCIRTNVLVMLETLFPTYFPAPNDIKNSFDILNGKLTPGLLGASSYGRFSYLQDGGIYTFRKLIWMNDIINHPEYRELIKQYVNLYKKVQTNKKYEHIFTRSFRSNMNKSIEFNNFYKALSNLKEYRKLSTNTELQNLIDYDENGKNPPIYEFLKKVAIKYDMIEGGDTNKGGANNDNDETNNVSYDIGITILKSQNEPTCEIYVLAELFGGELNEDKMKKIQCKLEGERLGNEFIEVNQGKAEIRPWDLKRFSSYIDTDKMTTEKTDTADLREDIRESENHPQFIFQQQQQQQGVSINDVKAWFYNEINKNEEFLNNMNNVLQQTVDFQMQELLSIDNIVEYIKKNNSELYNSMDKMTGNQNKVANSGFKYKLQELYLDYNSKTKLLTKKIEDMEKQSSVTNTSDLQKLKTELYYNNIYLLVSKFLYELEEKKEKERGYTGGRKKKSFTKKRSSKKRLANKWRKRVSRSRR